MSGIGVVSLADGQALSTRVGADTVIDFNGGDSITLLGVRLTDHYSDGFFFA